MHKNATKCNETIGKWCKNKHGASKIIDTFEMYQEAVRYLLVADADLLVAAGLIVADRGMMQFSVTSPASVQAFKGAFGLAFQVAKHPQPQNVVSFWMKSPLSVLQQNLGNLPVFKNLKLTFRLTTPQRFLDCPPDLGNAWDLVLTIGINR
jgi:hypothetical protein